MTESDTQLRRPWFSSRLGWVDRAGLGLAVAVLAFFLMVWVVLIWVAGPAPTGGLSARCLTWMLHAEGWMVFPLWCCAKGTSLIARAVRALPRKAPPAAIRQAGWFGHPG